MHIEMKKHHNSGFSLTELMISLAIGLFLIVGVVLFMHTSTSSYVATAQMNQIQDSGRAAINLISSSLRRAGYKGLYVHPLGDGGIGGTLGASANSATFPSDNTKQYEWMTMMGQSLFSVSGSDGGSAIQSYSAYLKGTDGAKESYLRGDAIIVRNVSAPVSEDDITDGEIYFRGSLNYAAIFYGQEEDQKDNMPSGNKVTTHQLVANAFYVGDSGRKCGDEVIPSLFRVSATGAGVPIKEELIPGIEHLQIRVLLDGSYQDPDDVDLDEWKNVTAARIWVLARANCIDGTYTHTETYSMGDETYTVKDSNFRRQLFSTTVTFRNVL